MRGDRAGGWNDFVRNLRSSYRATLPPDNTSFNLGFRLARNAVTGSGNVASSNAEQNGQSGGGVLIAYFSWGGNTRGIAEEIQRQTGAELFEIELVTPYSMDYNTVLEEAQRDQNAQARPELSTHVADMSRYDTIILGYPNWNGDLPMPLYTFLETYDFSGKTIIPFVTHGGSGFSRTISTIQELQPNAEVVTDGLSVSRNSVPSAAQQAMDWAAGILG